MIDLDPEALEELAEAAAWYEEQREGLSVEFLDEAHRVMDEIIARPASFPRLRDVPDDLVIRRALLERFPFGLVFLERVPGQLRIIAVAHTKRRPGYWLRRTRD